MCRLTAILSLAGVMVLPLAGRARETWVNQLTVPVIVFREANGVRLEDETIAGIEVAAGELREFFFRNSGCRLLLKEAGKGFDYFYIDEEPVGEEELIDGKIFAEESLEDRLRSYGFGEGSLDSIVLYLPTRNGGGGLSAGANYLGANGAAHVFVNNTRNRYWFLFGAIHEFHHQVDSIFNRAGHSEYLLCHYHANAFHWPFWAEPFPWYFGERFAGDGEIVRHWPDDLWMETGEFGTVRALPDRDGDRVPDDGEHERWGGDPDDPDGDGDGLDDLAEALAGYVGGSNPASPDTDGDGLPDGTDPHPRYPSALSVPYLQNGIIEIDGIISPDEPWHKLIAGYEDPALNISEGLNPSVYLTWSGEFIALAVAFEKPCNLTVKLDTAGDSYCRGQDNYRIIWNANQGQSSAPEAAVYIGSLDVVEMTSYGDYDQQDRYPFNRLIGSDDWEAAATIRGGLYTLEVRINANALTGCLPRDGGEVGVNVCFQEIEDDSSRSATVFEYGDFVLSRLEPRSGLFMEKARFGDGDFGDGLPGEGEEGDLVITLKNGSGQDFPEVIATLSCPPPGITILDGMGSFSEIPAGQSAENEKDPFRLRVEDEFGADPTVVFCHLVASAEGSPLFDGMIGLPINGYADRGLGITPFSVETGIGPGEQGNLNLNIRGNYTVQPVTNARATLVSLDDRLEVIEGSSDLGSRDPYQFGSFISDDLVISISESAPRGEYLQAGLIAQYDEGEPWARLFRFPVSFDSLPGWDTPDLGFQWSLIPADLDGDGDLEIPQSNISTGEILLFDHKLGVVWEREGESRKCVPAVVDLDLDGVPEIIGTIWEEDSFSLHVYTADGEDMASFPLEGTRPYPIQVVVEDMDNSGEYELLISSYLGITALTLDGESLEGWPIEDEFYVDPYCAVGDVDGDGDAEVAYASDSPPLIHCRHHADFDGDGLADELPGWPVSIDMPGPVRIGGASVLVDLDGDGDREIVLSVLYADPEHPEPTYYREKVLAYHHDGSRVAGWGEEDIAVGYSFQELAAGDIDRDGLPEIIACCAWGIYAFNGSGATLAGWPVTAHGSGSGCFVGDMDGDGIPDVVFTAGPTAWFCSADGALDFIRPIGRAFGKDSAITDIDGSGTVDFLTCCSTEQFGYDLDADYDPCTMEWPLRHHDQRNTRCYRPGGRVHLSFPDAGGEFAGVIRPRARIFSPNERPREVRFEVHQVGGEWISAGTVFHEPWSAAWDTTAVPNGDNYEIRAVLILENGKTCHDACDRPFSIFNEVSCLPGVRLEMPSDYYTPGDSIYLNAIICNGTAADLENTPLVVLLDIGMDKYWFWPSWCAWPEEGIDYLFMTFEPGETIVPIIPEFIWPDIYYSMSGLQFYGAILNQEMTEILGELGQVEFGYGPGKALGGGNGPFPFDLRKLFRPEEKRSREDLRSKTLPPGLKRLIFESQK